MSFSPGIYRYYYEASDGVRTTQWPGQAHSETDPGTSLAALNAERSINTFRVNHAPVLSNPSVTPGTGPEDGQFTFEVTYQDQDGDQPLKPWLYIEQPAGSGQYRRVTMVPKNPVTWPTTQPVVYKYETGTDFQLTQECTGTTSRSWTTGTPPPRRWMAVHSASGHRARQAVRRRTSSSTARRSSRAAL